MAILEDWWKIYSYVTKYLLRKLIVYRNCNPRCARLLLKRSSRDSYGCDLTENGDLVEGTCVEMVAKAESRRSGWYASGSKKCVYLYVLVIIYSIFCLHILHSIWLIYSLVIYAVIIWDGRVTRICSSSMMFRL